MNPQGFSGDDLMMKTSSVSSVTMEPLPDEVLLRILHHLGPEDLILASQVSESWNRVARDSSMWKDVALTWRNFPNTAKIQSYVSRVLGRFSPQLPEQLYPPLSTKPPSLQSSGFRSWVENEPPGGGQCGRTVCRPG